MCNFSHKNFQNRSNLAYLCWTRFSLPCMLNNQHQEERFRLAVYLQGTHFLLSEHESLVCPLLMKLRFQCLWMMISLYIWWQVVTEVCTHLLLVGGPSDFCGFHKYSLPPLLLTFFLLYEISNMFPFSCFLYPIFALLISVYTIDNI